MNVYNTLENIKVCKEIVDQASQLLYYSHIITATVALLVGFFVLYKSKLNFLSRILFLVTFFFGLWSMVDFFVWIKYYNSEAVTFLWSFYGIIHILIYIFSAYFIIVFIKGEDISIWSKIIFLSIIFPIILFASSTYNIVNFDLKYCNAIEGSLYTNYYLFLSLFIVLLILFYVIFKWNRINSERKKTVLYLLIGIELFLIIFYATVAGVSYLIENGFISDGNYNLEQYGLFSMPIFIAFLAYLIVKFKAFEIKLLATQALVWAMVIMIGSQFFFIKSTVNMILNGITFLFMIIAGIMLVRSVKRVDEQRELLDMANKNQQSLLHFITHQVKGFMTKTRGIFSGILEGDFGEINGKVREMAEYGLASETKGVETIQNILHASDLKSGTIEFIKKEFDLTTLVKGLIEDLRKKITDKGLEIEEYIQSKPIKFLGDELRIKEVCKNILDNAILYTDHGKITINLRQIDGKIIFSVKDSGIGLSESDKKDLFTEGGRGEESLAHNIDSTGYGLFIAKQIVKEHKGTIWAESQGRGKGSEFVVELPKI